MLDVEQVDEVQFGNIKIIITMMIGEKVPKSVWRTFLTAPLVPPEPATRKLPPHTFSTMISVGKFTGDNS